MSKYLSTFDHVTNAAVYEANAKANNQIFSCWLCKRAKKVPKTLKNTVSAIKILPAGIYRAYAVIAYLFTFQSFSTILCSQNALILAKCVSLDLFMLQTLLRDSFA